MIFLLRSRFAKTFISTIACAGMSAIAVDGVSAAPSPRAYCAKIGNDDQLRPTTTTLAPAIKRLFNVSGAYALQSTYYRCADGKVLLCNVGANIPCGKANLSKSLPGATAWCKDNPNSDFIPMVATGHDTIYTWRCTNGAAVAGAPASKVDARGFISDVWETLK